MSAEYRQDTSVIEYVICGLGAWHILAGSICGVLQVLGFNLSLGWAAVIALIITVLALVKIWRDERPYLRALPQDGPLAQIFAKDGGAMKPPPELPPVGLFARSVPTAEPKRKASAREFLGGVSSIWMLAMGMTAVVASSVREASLIALGITFCALLAIYTRGRSLPTVGPLARLFAQEKRVRMPPP